MNIAALLAVVDGGAGSRAVLEAAFGLARRTDAYLEVIHVQPDPADSVPLVGEGMSGAMVDQVMSELRARAESNAARARELFERQCAARDLPPLQAGAAAPTRGRAVFRDVEGREDEELARRSRLFDLIVVARPDGGEAGGYAPGLEAVLFDGGRPVLVVPPEAPPHCGERVVVAWNGRREAARAATAALGLLSTAAAVTVVSVEEHGGSGGRDADPSELAAWLGLHAVEARVRRVPLAGSAGATLLAEAEAAGADLLVMGAYGHSRLRQFIVGGATRSVLAQSPLAVLMAH